MTTFQLMSVGSLCLCVLGSGQRSVLAEGIEEQLLGKWSSVAVDWGGDIDGDDENHIWEFTRSELIIKEPKKTSRVRYRLFKQEGQTCIDITYYETEYPYVWKGIARLDGGSLQICARFGATDETIERPSEFKVKRGDKMVKMLLFSKTE